MKLRIFITAEAGPRKMRWRKYEISVLSPACLRLLHSQQANSGVMKLKCINWREELDGDGGRVIFS